MNLHNLEYNFNGKYLIKTSNINTNIDILQDMLIKFPKLEKYYWSINITSYSNNIFVEKSIDLGNYYGIKYNNLYYLIKTEDLC